LLRLEIPGQSVGRAAVTAADVVARIRAKLLADAVGVSLRLVSSSIVNCVKNRLIQGSRNAGIPQMPNIR
jgi:hypothetical protein